MVTKPVIIGSDCWLGANVLVLPGVTVGDGAVVGAGSVLLKLGCPLLLVWGTAQVWHIIGICFVW